MSIHQLLNTLYSQKAAIKLDVSEVIGYVLKIHYVYYNTISGKGFI
ncbi:hypothetical protein JYQ62_34760 [Nostoc sp. UHCC 0702]|nr:hypothetical protein JYQ62_34760 [Nostoc sp. UHCC 0702]